MACLPADALELVSGALREVESLLNLTRPFRLRLRSGIMDDTDRHHPEGLSKRTVALTTGYVGTGYKGSSINRHLGDDATIEQVLEKAIYKAGFVTEANQGSFSKLKWTRASRTDKGVHSLNTKRDANPARTLTSPLSPKREDTALGPFFHVCGAVIDARKLQVNKRFNARHMAGSRDYEYYLPASMLELPADPNTLPIASTHPPITTTVNKRFNARHMAGSRDYEYYLPASMLELSAELNSAEDNEKMAKFRTAIQTFVGNHPFHNYTKMRAHGMAVSSSQRYNALKKEKIDAAKAAGKTWDEWGTEVSPDEVRAALKEEAKVLAEEAKPQAEEAKPEDEEAKPQAEEAKPPVEEAKPQVEDSNQAEEQKVEQGGAKRSADAEMRNPKGNKKKKGDESEEDEDDEEGGELDDEEEEEEIEASDVGADGKPIATAVRRSRFLLAWTDTPSGGKEPISKTYYRNMLRGTPCIRIQVSGTSFMIHHIRHMIGTAVASALGLISPELLKASLQAPARITLPRAPPHTLMLAARRQRTGGDSGLASITGDKLHLKEGAMVKKEEFRKKVVLPALQQLVELPDWAEWKATAQKNFPYPEEKVAEILQAYKDWDEGMRERRVQKAIKAAQWEETKKQRALNPPERHEKEVSQAGEGGEGGDVDMEGKGEGGDGGRGRGKGDRGGKGGRGGGKKGKWEGNWHTGERSKQQQSPWAWARKKKEKQKAAAKAAGAGAEAME
eukprot:gene22177-29239_t